LLPLFPLQTVLFPGGLLPLRIFEARYMDLAARCLKDDSVFGVSLIAAGVEVGAAAEPHPVGVSARIVSCDMAQPGVLNIVARGEQRYRIQRTEVGPNNLLLGEVEWIAAPPPAAVPADFSVLVDLLQVILADAGEERFPPPFKLDDAGWVSNRYAEILPIPMLARQRLLELSDVQSRLEIIRTYLQQRGLLKP
jgi:Lon protease-like protein